MHALTNGRARAVAASLVVALGLVVVLPVAPAAAETVVPVQAGWQCADLTQLGGTGPWVGLYISTPPAPGTTGTFTKGAVAITVTTAADGNSVTWSANTTMDAVFVNAGEPGISPNASAVWVYDPPGPESTGGVVAGIGSATRVDHLRFCWDIEQVPPTTPPTSPPTSAPGPPTTPASSTPVTTAGTPTTGGTPTTTPTTRPGGSSFTLPATGSGGRGGTLLFGAAAALAGGALILAGRRRRALG